MVSCALMATPAFLYVIESTNSLSKLYRAIEYRWSSRLLGPRVARGEVGYTTIGS